MFGSDLRNIADLLKGDIDPVSFETEEIPEFNFNTERSQALSWVRELIGDDSGSDVFPIDILLEDKLRISVHREVLDGEEDLSGYIERRADGWHIGVNKYEVSGRQRFTLAHELAHLLFHRSIIEDKMIDGRFSESIKLFRSNESFKHIEMQANQFSADLLMPSDKMRMYWDAFTYEEMADKFGVSNYAIEYRGKTLKLLSKRE